MSRPLRVAAVREGAEVPARAYAGDAGLDLVAAEPVLIPPQGRAAVPCGIAVELPPGHCGLVVPRSGLALRHGVTVLNAPGLIDEGYRGEVQVILHNTDAAEAFAVEPGMRIAQLVVLALPQLALLEVADLAPSERGAAGFGSSGVGRR